jgi:hypothetical protein
MLRTINEQLARFAWFRRLFVGTWRSQLGARDLSPRMAMSSAWLEEHGGNE